MKELSVVIPAYNEEGGINDVLANLKEVLDRSGFVYEIIVVNDGSTDKTSETAKKFPVVLIENTHNSGYGFSIRKGLGAAKYEYVAIIDADGSYPADALPKLAEMMDGGYDMVVGARQGKHYWSSPFKAAARFIFKAISEYAAGRKIDDINSGLRVMRKSSIIPYLGETCSTFSFTTSLTLILMLNGLYVRYFPIQYFSRKGHSKIKLFKDTLRTGQVIIEAVAKYNPLKLYLLLSFAAVLLSVINFILYGFLRSAGFWISACEGLFFSILILSVGLLAVASKRKH